MRPKSHSMLRLRPVDSEGALRHVVRRVGLLGDWPDATSQSNADRYSRSLPGNTTGKSILMAHLNIRFSPVFPPVGKWSAPDERRNMFTVKVTNRNAPRSRWPGPASPAYDYVVEHKSLANIRQPHVPPAPRPSRVWNRKCPWGESECSRLW